MRFPVLLIIMIFISGCLQSIGSEEFRNDYIRNLHRTPINDPSQIEECKIGSCYCMVCQNGSPIWGGIWNNLVGGRCYMETECTPERAMELRNSTATPDLSIRNFMLGQGPSIGDFSDANPYCSNKLSMAVEWLVGNADNAYEMPDAGRALCVLSREIIPVYILYSEGENINAARAGEIGRSLANDGQSLYQGFLTPGPVGPNIVVTEIDYDISDAGQIIEQIRAVKNACGDACWVAVAPKIGDTEALDAVMASAGDQVDVIAFGVNGNYVDACSSGRISSQKMMNQVVNFTEYAVYTYGKPALIPYIMFDPDTTDINGCVWKESDVTAAYGAFIPGGIQRLRKIGVIGFAPYSFNSTSFGSVSNPLKCANCAIASNEQRLRAYYGACQQYTNISGTRPSYGNEILYPNESAGFCDFGTSIEGLLRETSYASVGGNRDYLSPNAPELRPVGTPSFRCSSCLLSNITSNPVAPFNFGGTASVDSSSFHGCIEYQDEINAWADARNLDPMLVRAFALIESNLDPGAAARVCKEGYTGTGPDGRPCFEASPAQDECYSNAYRIMDDPSGTYDFADAPDAEDLDEDPDWKWCGLGFMQSLEPPYTLWPASVNPSGEPGEFAWACDDAGICSENLLVVARGCAAETDPPGQFNPFNISHSLCIGTYKMQQGLNAARGIVRQMKSDGLLVNSNAENEEVLAAYIMAQMYGGSWGITGSSMKTVNGVLPPCGSETSAGDCFRSLFAENMRWNRDACVEDSGGELPWQCSEEGVPRWQPPEYCFGESDPAVFWDQCIQPFLTTPNNHGNVKMKQFFALQSCSTNLCPDGLKMLNDICTPDESGTLNEELCEGPGRPRIPESGSYYAQAAEQAQDN
ncbi:hypothetical protein JXA56_01230 [Candidatus Micrarchaeota archaeon]|nr:hypothetical protein [Candidatus Micrarchaeota archaeon]